MKTRNPLLTVSIVLVAVLLLAASNLRAAVTYWDPQGPWPAIPPTYTGDLSGTWETSAWSTSGTGQASGVPWIEGTAACFAVGVGAGTPDFTMTLNANHTIAGIFDGPLAPNSCHVTLNGPGVITLQAGQDAFDLITSSDGSTAFVTVSNVITGPGQITAEGNGQIFLRGTNTFTGGITLGYSATTFSGIVNFNNSASFGTGSIIVSNTAALTSALVAEGTGALTIANPVSVITSNNPSLNIVGTPAGVTFSGPWSLGPKTLSLGTGVAGNLVTIAGVIGGTGGLTKFNPATLALTATNTYSGVTTVTNGILQLGDGVARNGSVAGTITVTTPGSLVFANPTALTYAKVISGTGAFTKQAAGILTLSGAATYSGASTISAGTLKLGVANAIPSGAGKGDVSLAGTLDLGGFSCGVNGLNGAGLVDNTAGVATYTLTAGNNNASGSFSGIIQNTSGSVALTKPGSGMLTLGGLNTYSGLTMIGGGTLQLGINNALPSGSSVIVSNAATLDMAGLNDTIAALSGAGSVLNNNGALTVNGNAGPLGGQNFNGYSCIAGTLSGSGSFTKGGTHVMAFRGDNSTYAGPITFSGGTLSVGAAADRLPTSLALSIPAGALFQLDANNQTFSSLNGSGSVNLGGGVLTINQTGSDSFSGVIQNSELGGSSTALGHGLRGYYYTNIDFTGLAVVRDDATVNLPDMTALPAYFAAKTNQISVRWLGQVLTTVAGNYLFTTKCDDGSRLWVNGSLLVDNWILQGATAKSGTIALPANTRCDLVLEYFNNGAGGSAQLLWTPPGDASVLIPTSNLLLPGPGVFAKTGSGAQQLTVASSYSGGTTVGAGTLEAVATGALGSGNVTLANGATLVLDANPGINSAADLIAGAGATAINLAFSGTDNIHALSLDGGNNYQPVGTYGSLASSATHKLSLFTGTGILNVNAAPSTNVLTSSGTSLVYGSSLNLTSTITGSGVTPTGSVTFYDGGTLLATVPLNGSGIATFSISNLLVTASPHSLQAVFSGDAHYAQSASATLSVTTTVATITPIPVVATKIYDGTTAATIASTTFGGILDSDTNYVHISGAYTATFADKNVGTNKNVSITGLVLTGSLSGNYALSTTSVNTTGSITNKVLNITGITATNRVYDATVNEGVTGSASLVSAMIVTPDVVTLSGSPVVAFATKNSGLGKPVNVSGYSIGGADATNYVLVLTNLSANITNFSVAITSVTANSKPYDGVTIASLSGTPSLSPAAFGGDVVAIGGTVVANFNTAAVGNSKPVTVTGYVLTGADATNYTLLQPTGLTASITQAGTSASITSSSNPSTLTSNVTFKCTVTANTPSTNPPTGTVTFFTNSVAVSPVVTLVSNTPTSSIASFTTALLPVGTNTVQAVYGGDVNFLAPAFPFVATSGAERCLQPDKCDSGDGLQWREFLHNRLQRHLSGEILRRHANQCGPANRQLAARSQ